ncbi:hypothetical protein [Glutamicibacter sp. JC586]|uniref:hypothetical protein n=1 Tax=Glutamicibacter sp. JC586 TaxID=2590552 RepID=UPI001358859B|nr:hypothetical protein [Glutamicibacter sp. JC586]
MIASNVDPRYADEQDLSPTYRVDFWSADGASEEWRLVDVKDVHEVFEWVSSNSRGREASVCVEYSNLIGGQGNTALLRLSGPAPA